MFDLIAKVRIWGLKSYNEYLQYVIDHYTCFYSDAFNICTIRVYEIMRKLVKSRLIGTVKHILKIAMKNNKPWFEFYSLVAKIITFDEEWRLFKDLYQSSNVTDDSVYSVFGLLVKRLDSNHLMFMMLYRFLNDSRNGRGKLCIKQLFLSLNHTIFEKIKSDYQFIWYIASLAGSNGPIIIDINVFKSYYIECKTNNLQKNPFKF